MYDRAREIFARALTEIEDAGLTKRERALESPQAAAGRPVALIFTTATSVFGSVATTRPLNCRRSARMTSTSTASATT